MLPSFINLILSFSSKTILGVPFINPLDKKILGVFEIKGDMDKLGSGFVKNCERLVNASTATIVMGYAHAKF